MKPTGTQVLAEFFNCSRDILNNRKEIENALRDGINKHDLGLISINSHCYEPIGITSIAVISESHVAIHTYPEARHASLDIYTCSKDNTKSKALLDYLRDCFLPGKMRIAEMTRGNPMELKNTSWITDDNDADGFDIRYHIKETLYHNVSSYQDIKIIDNENFGRMLFLDNELQIAEKDVNLYNKSLVIPIVESGIPLNNIAILGGGDGGVLNELLQHGPGSVTLVDIDSEVVEASKSYLGGICDGAFDDARVNVVHEDAFSFLEVNNRFDAIIYDLTMHPEAFIVMDREEYLTILFEKIKMNLNAHGMATFQCCSEFDNETYTMTEMLLKKVFSDIEFRETYIPSFCTKWLFATAFKG